MRSTKMHAKGNYYVNGGSDEAASTGGRKYSLD